MATRKRKHPQATPKSLVDKKVRRMLVRMTIDERVEFLNLCRSIASGVEGMSPEELRDYVADDDLL
jgi:hypothetical protein